MAGASVGFAASPTPDATMTLVKGIEIQTDESMKLVMRTLARRVMSIRTEHDFFRQWCDRADLLYYPDRFTTGGADLWPDDPSAKIAGRSHVSINSMSAYVDIPSALQAVEPIENMDAIGDSDEARDAAAALGRVYEAWKGDENMDLKFHKATTVKGLYGRTAARVYYDYDAKKPCAEIVEQPRNLYLGYKTDNYEQLEWAAYRLLYEPNALIEAFGVDVTPYEDVDRGVYLPMVEVRDFYDIPPRQWLTNGDARIEVWDYWYRQPVWRGTKFIRMDTYNVVIAGNVIIKGPELYKAYKGKLPYVPLFNTFIPGVPDGRADLWDAEPLLREKMEIVTGGSQMIHNGTTGDMWQLVGADAPIRVPAGLKPEKNKLVGPGPGNRIETITPFIAQFQLEQFLGRIDRELATVTGLNDLLLGLAPSQVLNSSKAINALIANYEARLSMRRKLLYKWRRDVWELALDLWVAEDKTVAMVVSKGGGRLDIQDPSLSPRDDMETAQRAGNNVNAKLWSQRRAMSVVGVDDPETEQDMIREESTDATLWPERVQVMAQLMATFQSLGLQANSATQGQAQAQATSGMGQLQNALGAQTPDNSTGMQSPDTQGQTPQVPMPPFAAAGQPGLQNDGGQGGMPGRPGGPPVLQNQIKGGKVGPQTSIKSQVALGRR
jgi:hypothetical protein